MRRRPGAVIGASLLGTILLSAGASAAQSGPSADALTAVVKVPVPDAMEPGLSVATTLGYAAYDPRPDTEGWHHRVGGALAVGAVPTDWLAFSLTLGAQYFGHPADSHQAELGDDRTVVLVNRLATRAVFGTTTARFGAEIGFSVPGKEAPSLAFDAPAADLRFLAAWSTSTVTFAGHGAYRLDYTGRARSVAVGTRPGDRLALGLSDFDAVLLGVGLRIPIGAAGSQPRAELLVEGRAELLVGSGAPIGHSPLTASVGGRVKLADRWWLEASAQATLGPRARIDAEQWVPAAPRVAAHLGFRWRWEAGSGSTATPLASSSPEPPTPQAPPISTAADSASADSAPADPASSDPEPRALDAAVGSIRGIVRGFDGSPVQAHVTVEPGTAEASSDAEGMFELELEPGTYRVTIVADGFRSQKLNVRVGADEITVINADLWRR